MTDNFQPIVQVRPATPDWRDRRIAELEAQLQQAKAENAALKERIAQLQRQIAELERSGKRQETPFSRQERKADPKRPGRKTGQDLFSHRAKPKPEEVDETKEEPLCSCPDGGGPLTDMNAHEQFEIDIPEVQPKVTRYVTHSGYCSQCRRRVRSHHPEQISEATGAAGVLICSHTQQKAREATLCLVLFQSFQFPKDGFNHFTTSQESFVWFGLE